MKAIEIIDDYGIKRRLTEDGTYPGMLRSIDLIYGEDDDGDVWTMAYWLPAHKEGDGTQ